MKRRDFLSQTSKGLVLSSLLSKVNPFFASSSLLDAFQSYDTDRVLVIIQLAGGNDGLNTVIPIDQYANLVNVRQNILIPEARILSLDNQPATGLHPSLTGFRQLFNEGKMNIIQSVGYEQPDFSHFRSTDIWLSGSDSGDYLSTGWVGRYLHTEYPNFPIGFPNTTMPDPLSIQINDTLSLALMSEVGAMGTIIDINSNGTVSFGSTFTENPLSGYYQHELEYLRIVANQSEDYSVSVQAAASQVTAHAPYPSNNKLADQLKYVSKLIKGGLKTRIYKLTLHQFDTHAYQTDANNPTLGRHSDLLKTLSDAVTAFVNDLSFQGTQDRVVGMVFSEFGRRIRSNDSRGTDHGAAAPVFLFGNPVASGIIGSNVEVLSNTTFNDNIPYQYDFRSVYTSLLKKWFCVSETDLNAILFRSFQELPILEEQANCLTTHIDNVKAGISLVTIYPNPFTSTISVEYTTHGGYTSIQIINSLGQVIASPFIENTISGTYTLNLNLEHLASGNYWLRFQNGTTQQVKPIIKTH